MTHPALNAVYRILGLEDSPGPQTSEPAVRTTQPRAVKRDTRDESSRKKPQRKRATVKPQPSAGADAATDPDQ